MVEHTPGPWMFDGGCQIVEGARPHMRVAFLPSDHHEYASSAANGYLLAAAPDMLAALERLLGQFVACARHAGNSDETIEIATEFARAAIAKARGAITAPEGNRNASDS